MASQNYIYQKNGIQIECWRKNLKTCGDTDDIFEVIDRAILIAALDHPKEFKNHRDDIMEKLYYKTETLLDNDLHREKEKAFNGVDHNKVYEDRSTIDHVDGVQDSVNNHAHCVISNRSKSSNNKILPVICMKRMKKMNSQDGWVATIVPRKMEEGSEQVTKCYNNGTGADCQRTSYGSIHQILSQENKNSTKQVQASCLDEEAMMIQQKIETSKRKLKEGYQAAAKKQHLVKVLDPRDLPKSCAALHVSQRNHKGPAVGRNHKGPAVGRCY